jgi:NADPH-dependent ferric siderophore reductase
VTAPTPRPSLSGRRRPAPLRAQVLRSERLTPRLVRLSVTGPDFDRYRWQGPAAHFKLMLPEPGTDDVELPEPDQDGTVDFAAGPRSTAPTMRTYTARDYDAETQVLDIDFVLHGHGPAASWAQQARPGDRLAVTVPRAAGFVEDPEADWVLLAGDTSALPAVATIAAVLTTPATIIVAAADPAEQIDLGLAVQWLTGTGPDPTAAKSSNALEHAIAGFTVPPGRGQVWVAAEAAAIRRIRAGLLTRIDPSQVTTRGYWRIGEANHPDHDYGDTSEK